MSFARRMLLNKPNRFGSLAISLHWLTLVAIVIAYASMEFRGLAPKGPTRDLVKSIHFSAGLSVLVFAAVRLLVYLRGPHPRITPSPPAWQERLAKWTHRGLYAWMFLLPMVGWLILSAKASAVPLPGLELPALPLPPNLSNRATAHNFEEVHEILANLGYALIGLHAAAALFHHYVLHDDTLVRMLPRRRQR